MKRFPSSQPQVDPVEKMDSLKTGIMNAGLEVFLLDLMVINLLIGYFVRTFHHLFFELDGCGRHVLISVQQLDLLED